MLELRRPNEYRSIECLSQVRANGRVMNVRAMCDAVAPNAPPPAQSSAAKQLPAPANASPSAPERPQGQVFHSARLNNAIVIKHNVRDNERALFARPRYVATKIILPVDPDNLSLGGATFMLGERQAPTILRDKLSLQRCSEDPRVKYDLKVLDLLDQLPTLDPFIVKERFAVDGLVLPERFSSFQLSGDDGMHRYLRAQLMPLVQMALRGKGGGYAGESAMDRLFDEIFSGQLGGRVDPLRTALKIEAQDWPGALYTWKAALYYEFRAKQFEGRYERFLHNLQNARIFGFTNMAPADVVLQTRQSLAERAIKTKAHLDQLLASFDQAFRGQLLGQGSPEAFRDYLLSLGDRLYDFGVVYGVLEQMVGYWEYWFLSRGVAAIPAEFFYQIGRDLLASGEVAREVVDAKAPQTVGRLPAPVPKRPEPARSSPVPVADQDLAVVE